MAFSLDFDSITKTSDLRELRIPITLSFSLPLAGRCFCTSSQFISRILFLTTSLSLPTSPDSTSPRRAYLFNHLKKQNPLPPNTPPFFFSLCETQLNGLNLLHLPNTSTKTLNLYKSSERRFSNFLFFIYLPFSSNEKIK